ncbi:MAG: ribulose-bisphosphate carboxylase large subunit family protein [Bryobacterales bacterium]|nr:ribulose-bisphosphate carboxylase large subunit family protein [Bryobacterales bacterium]
MSPDRIYAKYWVESAFPLQKAVEVMAGEQSSGTFIKVPGETEELKNRHAARVESLTELEPVAVPSLPGARVPKGTAVPVYHRGEAVLSWPLSNMGASLQNLMATVAGNLFELQQFSGLRLLDMKLPQPFRDKYPGPQFGVAGTRLLTGVQTIPLVGTIIKPSVGLSPEATAGMVGQLAEGGIDFIKDDELQADGPHCPFEDRVVAVMRVINDHADRTGKKVMFAFNLSGDIDEMRRRHDFVLAHGGTCVMVSVNGVGLTGVVELRRHSQLPIHGHRNGWGLFSRSPYIGMSFLAYQKFWRLAGVDHIHVNGLRNKFCEPDDSVMASARECLSPMFEGEGRGCEIMPVFSSGQWAGMAIDTYKAIQSTDLIFACGGGIVAHPAGIGAGVRSIQQAWKAALAGQSLDEAAAQHSELRQAIQTFEYR